MFPSVDKDIVKGPGADPGVRNRFFSVSADLFRRPVDDTPQCKVHKAFKIEHNYLDSQYVVNQNDAFKANTLISDFFTTEIDGKQAKPFNKAEWKSILQDNKLDKCEAARLERSIKDGLPREYRIDIWLYLAGTEKNKIQYSKQDITYEGLKSQPCVQEHKIMKDITRSFADHDFFKDHEDRVLNMKNILQAYANFDPEVGYTQGMNFLVGMLLYLIHTERVEQTKNIPLEKGEGDIDLECEVFWIFVYIMQEKEWRRLYLNDMPKLQELLDKLDLKIQHKLPDLHSLVTQNVCLPTCFAQYYLTILLYGSPQEFAKRVLETFLFAGEEILHHILIQVLTICQNQILTYEKTEELHSFLGEQLFKTVLE